MQFYGENERPKTLKLFEPKNPEYMLASSIIQETMEIASPKIFWFSKDHAETDSKLTEIDTTYGEEASSKKYFKQPVEVVGFVDVNPMLIELTKLGFNNLREINLIVNILDFVERVGDKPKEGDVFRVTFLSPIGEDENIFYSVATVFPTDQFNHMYLDLMIGAEQTDLADVHEEVKSYFNME